MHNKNTKEEFTQIPLFNYFSKKEIYFFQMKIDVKEAIIFGAGLLTLVAGIVLTYIGIYAPPVGEISGSVLAALGEFLTFAGSAMGIGSYTAIQIHKINKTMKKDENYEVL